MIYTVTLNPSLDYVVSVDGFAAGKLNRTQQTHVFPGGKGINVSIVLQNLGIPSRALGFLAGFTGREIQRMLQDYGCACDFIDLPEGLSRINMKIKSDSETEVNGEGPAIPNAQFQMLLQQLDTLQPGDTLVLAGSVPKSVPEDVYERICARLSERGVRFVVDASGPLLQNVLRYHPFLIKPNDVELGELFGVTIHSDEQIVDCARQLQRMGAQHVLVSLAGDGALLVTADGQTLRQRPPQGTVVNSVGAGDSMVAGFLAGLAQGMDMVGALSLAICAGSATAFTHWLAGREEILALYQAHTA